MQASSAPSFFFEKEFEKPSHIGIFNRNGKNNTLQTGDRSDSETELEVKEMNNIDRIIESKGFNKTDIYLQNEINLACNSLISLIEEKRTTLMQRKDECAARFRRITDIYKSDKTTDTQSVYKLQMSFQNKKHELEILKNRYKTEKQRRVDEMLKMTDLISPTEFELFIASIFDVLGFDIVEHCGGTGDHGIDLKILHSRLGNGIVQVKQYSKQTRVTESQFRDLLGSLSASKSHTFCYMVCSSTATKAAIQWVIDHGLTHQFYFWDRIILVQLCNKYADQIWPCFVKRLKSFKDSRIKSLQKQIKLLQGNRKNHKNDENNGNNDILLTPKPVSLTTHAHRRAKTTAGRNRNRTRIKLKEAEPSNLSQSSNANSLFWEDSDIEVTKSDRADNETTEMSCNKSAYKRAKRREWSADDDKLLLSYIRKYGTKTSEQWDAIVEHKFEFEVQRSKQDMRAHWKKVLKPKLDSSYNMNS